jgi:hypothetical protein
MLRIDHVFVSRSVRVTGVHVPRHAAARIASDHLPLVVDFRIDKRGWAERPAVEAAAVVEAVAAILDEDEAPVERAA